MENSTEPKEELKFEQALARLEEIVAMLEGGRLSLEESMTRFEEGMQLNQLCRKKLQEAEQRIERLMPRPDGSVESVPMP